MAGNFFGRDCPVCGIAVEQVEDYRCTVKGCPCRGMRPGTPEAEQAASRHFLGIGASKRTMTGEAAYDDIERDAAYQLRAAEARAVLAGIETLSPRPS